MTKARTPLGIGELVETSSTRGVTSHLVEGPGFSSWFKSSDIFTIDEPEEIDEENSTTLPYNPTPQYPVEFFPDESTLQPVHEIDSDERTEDSDSLSVNEINSRLGDKFVKLRSSGVDRDSILGRMTSDPERFAREVRATLEASTLDSPGSERLADHFYLMDEDRSVREAAWKDVRSKAVRLRNSGNVNVQEISPRSIYALVEGDNDIYPTVVVRGGATVGSGSITEWACGCEWGRWAFKREHTYVGRLCSHAYAAFMELQSQTKIEFNKDIDKKRRREDKVQPAFLPTASDGSSEYEELDDLNIDNTPLVEEPIAEETLDEIEEDTDLGEDQRSYSDYSEEDDEYIVGSNRSRRATQLHKPFNGSGRLDPIDFETSAERALREDEMEDVTDLEERVSRRRYAGRAFSLKEQLDLINEAQGDDEILGRLDLRGTHYEF